MKTRKMMKHLMEELASIENVEIVGRPRNVPHGGMAADVRNNFENSFAINCFQVYGTDEVLSHAELILRDKNYSKSLNSPYMRRMREGCEKKLLIITLPIIVVPMEDDCINRMRTLENKRNQLFFLRNMLTISEEGGIDRLQKDLADDYALGIWNCLPDAYATRPCH